MDPGVRARLASAILILGAVWAYFSLREPLVAGVFVLAGVVLALSIPVRRVRGSEMEAALRRGQEEALSSLKAALGLEGDPVYVPLRGGVVRVFYPARKGEVEVPLLEEDTVLVRGGPGSLGVALVPPGAGLVELWGRLRGLPKGGGVEEAIQHVRAAAKWLRVPVKVGKKGEGLTVLYGRSKDRRVEKEVFGSFVAVLVVMGVRRAMRVTASEDEKGRVGMEMVGV
ncbi:MAG: hypothetical protein KY455_09620 [Euryarchaeota archaeon]|nr:hypothetical protein [Euryarchaeota archaeon]